MVDADYMLTITMMPLLHHKQQSHCQWLLFHDSAIEVGRILSLVRKILVFEIAVIFRFLRTGSGTSTSVAAGSGTDSRLQSMYNNFSGTGNLIETSLLKFILSNLTFFLSFFLAVHCCE